MEKDKLLYLIELNNNIIGAYDNLIDAEIYIHGCFQNDFFISAKIKIFKLNSCFSQEIKSYSSSKIIKTDTKPIISNPISLQKEKTSFLENNEEFLQMGQTVPIDGIMPLLLQTSRDYAFCPENDTEIFRQNRDIPSYIVSNGDALRK